MWKIVALLGLIGSPALAQTSEVVAHCATYGDLAAEMMTQRQNGTAISTILGVLSDEETQEKEMVMEAFDVPRFHSPSGQQRAVDDYRASIEVRCLRAVM